MVKCLKCNTDLGPLEKECPICHTPRSIPQPESALRASWETRPIDTEPNITYLRAAESRITRSISDEEQGTQEYEDLANMMDLAGLGGLATSHIRPIIADEKRHIDLLEQAREIVRGILK